MKKATILGIIVSEDCETNRNLIQAAVDRLEKQGYAQAVPLGDLASAQGKTALLVIDGDEAHLTPANLADSGIQADFHLVVTQLGIETREDYSEEDLELLIDGIKAACTVTDGPTPQFNCPCCGSL